jgi:hypothetical protein
MQLRLKIPLGASLTVLHPGPQLLVLNVNAVLKDDNEGDIQQLWHNTVSENAPKSDANLKD